MVGCDTCDEWYHASCVGIDFLEVLKAGDAGYPFICEKCKKQADSKSKKAKQNKKQETSKQSVAKDLDAERAVQTITQKA